MVHWIGHPTHFSNHVHFCFVWPIRAPVGFNTVSLYGGNDWNVVPLGDLFSCLPSNAFQSSSWKHECKTRLLIDAVGHWFDAESCARPRKSANHYDFSFEFILGPSNWEKGAVGFMSRFEADRHDHCRRKKSYAHFVFRSSRSNNFR